MTHIDDTTVTEAATSTHEVSGYSDGQLLERVRRGDRAAWGELVHRHAGRLWAVARSQGLDRDMASDVVQFTWLALVDSAAAIREPESLRAWLVNVAKHEAIRVSKKFNRESPTLDDSPCETADERVEAPEARLEKADDVNAVQAALARLGRRCRSLLQLLFADADLSYAEISEVTGMPIGSIGPRRGRCLAELRRLLES